MKRKTLISIALLIIMLLNCILPLFVVHAVDGEEIQLNSKLYNAVKADLQRQNIPFTSNDITRVITLSPMALNSVTKLALNEGGIYDITGIEKFTGLTHLELSGNNLSKTSNLAVLNNLEKLEHLDLSTNNIDDVSEISGLVDRLQESGKIILSGQTVTRVYTQLIDTQEDSNNELVASFELPQILEKAGYIKSCWKHVDGIKETPSSVYPTLDPDSVPMYVTASDKNFRVNIAREVGENVEGNYGMLELCIYIWDEPSEASSASNVNRSSQNLLNGSRFYIYVVVCEDSCTPIPISDINLYTAIKSQLTGGQKINKDLSSYPYTVDENGETIYEYFYYEEGTGSIADYRILRDVRTGEAVYLLRKSDHKLYIYTPSGTRGEEVRTGVTDAVVEVRKDNGVLERREGYKIAFIGDDQGNNLYVQAYDKCKTFVITNSDLMNKITSLILNNKQIRDLTGLRYFVGLNSKLNVSHNYLSNIEDIYELQGQKDLMQSELATNYSKWLRDRDKGNLSKSTDEVKSGMDATKGHMKSIEAIYKNIVNLLVDAGTLDPEDEKYSENRGKKKEDIYAQVAKIWGEEDDEGNYVPGVNDLIYGYTNTEGKTVKGSLETTNNGIYGMYSYLAKLYKIYSNHYKLTTLLADDLNYITADEYDTYYNATSNPDTATQASAKALLDSQVSYVKELESNQALTELDKMLFEEMFGINIIGEKDPTPLSTYLTELMANREFTRIGAVNLIKKFREVALYSEMANYCLIERMNRETVAADYCFEKEYLRKRISELEIEYMDATLEKNVLTIIENKDDTAVLEARSNLPGNYYDVYKTYNVSSYEYSNKDTTTLKKVVKMCCGTYQRLEKMEVDYIRTTADELKNAALEKAAEAGKTINDTALNDILVDINGIIDRIVKEFHLYENIAVGTKYYRYNPDTLHLYDQLLSLSSRLVKGNVERYVTLPPLKHLDISYNAELENIDRLGELTALTELNASYDYISDVQNVAWENVTHLRKLCLAYNFISDIRPFSRLTNLRYLDLSKNLFAGELKISEEECYQLFKKLEFLDLSSNKLEDINSIVIYLDYISGGNYANYLAREDTVDIRLNDQEITINVEEPIYLSEFPTTVEVTLPRIFTQLMAIDTERTAFGTTSEIGRIVNEGPTVVLNTRTPGDKKGVVTVIPMSGDGSTVDYCVGMGTTATIYYKVVTRTVTGVRIDPSDNVEMLVGEKRVFTATVSGENLAHSGVTWTVTGNTSELTTISEDGELTIGLDETSDSVTITATSKEDTTQSASVTVKIPENNAQVSAIIIDPRDNIFVNKNKSRQFYATVEGLAEDKTVQWKVSGQTSAYTTISQEGLLSVGIDESADSVQVIAVSNADKTRTASVTARIVPQDQEIPVISLVDIIDPAEDKIEAKNGDNIVFKVSVAGTPGIDQTVFWTLNGNLSENTKLLSNGVLQIGEDETSDKLFVTATSNYDSSKKDSVEIDLPDNIKLVVDSVIIAPEANIAVKPGQTKQFIAIVEGTTEDKTVTWEIAGNSSTGTTISEDGLLTVGNDEESTNITIKATSKYDPSKSHTVTARIAGATETILGIDEIKLTPAGPITIEPKQAQVFTVQVTGTAPDKTVRWSVSGNTSKNTTVANGNLIQGATETSKKLIVKATSNYDTSKFATVEVNINRPEVVPEVTKVEVTPFRDVQVRKGGEKVFTATVEGTATDKTVIWKVEGQNSTNTYIDQKGKLVVGADETSRTLTVTATSNFDSTKYYSVTVTVTDLADDPEHPVTDITLQFPTKGEYVMDVKNRMPIEDFKSQIINDDRYTVVIKKDGNDVTTGFVGTGMYVQVQDSNGKVVKDTDGNLFVYEVVVKGDVNGDGNANTLDSQLIKSHRAAVSTLKGEYFEAADINSDGKINSEDSKLLLYHRAEVEGYNLNYVK